MSRFLAEAFINTLHNNNNTRGTRRFIHYLQSLKAFSSLRSAERSNVADCFAHVEMEHAYEFLDLAFVEFLKIQHGAVIREKKIISTASSHSSSPK